MRFSTRRTSQGERPCAAGGCLAGMAVLALFAAGCDEDLPKATEVTDMRLLGAKVEVVGDPTRATPEPGEKVDLRFATVFPSIDDDANDAQTMLISCTQPTRYTGGVPVCQEFLDAALGSEADVQAALEIATKVRCVDLPQGSYEIGTLALRCIDGPPTTRLPVSRKFVGDEMLYRGVVCEHGDAYIDVEDPLLFACDGNDGQTTRVHGTVTLRHDPEDENHNPDLSNAQFFLGTPGSGADGAAWPYVPDDELPPEDACLGTAARCDATAENETGVLCQYAYGSFQITLQFDPDAREKVGGAYEDLEFSVYATDGKLERRFVVFEGALEPVSVRRPIACREDADCAGHTGAYCYALNCVEGDERHRTRVTEKVEVLEGTVDWDVPEELRSRSQLVRFYFTALDRRGGFDITSRALCLN